MRDSTAIGMALGGIIAVIILVVVYISAGERTPPRSAQTPTTMGQGTGQAERGAHRPIDRGPPMGQQRGPAREVPNPPSLNPGTR